MYMDCIKQFTKKWKRIGNPNTDSENIQSGCRDGIRHRIMYHAYNEKRKTTNDGGKRTTKSSKNKNAHGKRNLQMGIFEGDTFKQTEVKE